MPPLYVCQTSNTGHRGEGSCDTQTRSQFLSTLCAPMLHGTERNGFKTEDSTFTEGKTVPAQEACSCPAVAAV